MTLKKITALIMVILIFVTNINAEEKCQNVYNSHKNSCKKIALSFDDGPHPKYTEEILDILDEFKIKATFFVVGENARLYPDIIREELNRGHEIGNHTMTHKNLKGLTYDEIRIELSEAEEALFEICDYKPKTVRPPGGGYSSTLIDSAEDIGYSVILWSIDTKDWAHTETNTITENIENNIKDGDILLFHDYITGVTHTEDTLRVIIPELINRGYSFVTVSELIGSY